MTSSSAGVIPAEYRYRLRIHGIDVSRTSALSTFGEAHAVAAVAPVVGEVLRHEVDLARALHLEQLRLAHDLVERERAVPAAHERDGAEGAAVVAPLADLEVAHVRRVAGVQCARRGARVTSPGRR